MSLTYSGNDFSVAAVMESPLSLPQNMSAAREFVTPAQLPLILRNEEMLNEVDSAIEDARESGRLIASHTLWNTKRFLQLLSADVPPTDAYVSERSEEHTSELQSLMRISYAVFCLKKKNIH